MMTTVEERIARLEAQHESTKEMLASIDAKLDDLIALKNMGRGALFTMLKVGAFLMILVAAVGWVWDRAKGLLS